MNPLEITLKALEFYAKRKNHDRVSTYLQGNASRIDTDRGNIAREAIEAVKAATTESSMRDAAKRAGIDFDATLASASDSFFGGKIKPVTTPLTNAELEAVIEHDNECLDDPVDKPEEKRRVWVPRYPAGVPEITIGKTSWLRGEKGWYFLSYPNTEVQTGNRRNMFDDVTETDAGKKLFAELDEQLKGATP